MLFTGLLLTLGQGCIANKVNAEVAEKPGSGSTQDWLPYSGAFGSSFGDSPDTFSSLARSLLWECWAGFE